MYIYIVLIIFLFQSVHSSGTGDVEEIEFSSPSGDENSIKATKAPDLSTLLSIYAANAHIMTLLRRLFGPNKTSMEPEELDSERIPGTPVLKEIGKTFECQSGDKFSCEFVLPDLIKSKDIKTSEGKHKKSANKPKSKSNCKSRKYKSSNGKNNPQSDDGLATRNKNDRFMFPLHKDSLLESQYNSEPDESIKNFNVNSKLYGRLSKVRQNRSFKSKPVVGYENLIRKKWPRFQEAKLEVDKYLNKPSKNNSKHISSSRHNKSNFTRLVKQILEAINKHLPQNISRKAHLFQSNSTRVKRPYMYMPSGKRHRLQTTQLQYISPVNATRNLPVSRSTIKNPDHLLIFLTLAPASKAKTMPVKLRYKSRIKIITTTRKLQKSVVQDSVTTARSIFKWHSEYEKTFRPKVTSPVVSEITVPARHRKVTDPMAQG